VIEKVAFSDSVQRQVEALARKENKAGVTEAFDEHLKPRKMMEVCIFVSGKLKSFHLLGV